MRAYQAIPTYKTIRKRNYIKREISTNANSFRWSANAFQRVIVGENNHLHGRLLVCMYVYAFICVCVCFP